MSSPTQGMWTCRHGVDGRDFCPDCMSGKPERVTVRKGDVIHIVPERGPERDMVVSHVEHHIITLIDWNEFRDPCPYCGSNRRHPTLAYILHEPNCLIGGRTS